MTAEAAPFAKVGGLADVAGGLPKALVELGHEVRVVMPLYQMILDDPRWQLSDGGTQDIRLGPGWAKTATIREILHEGVTFTFIGTDEWFPKAVSSETLYQPGAMLHLFLSEATLQVSQSRDWKPDVVHCNDWHTGLIPVLMREKYADATRCLFTIHNFAYQGEFGPEILDLVGLPRSIYTADKVEAWGRVNFIKAGCVYADAVNTVSPTYAQEIQTPEFGERLEGLMRFLSESGRLSGILNGIDTDLFDPATDPELAAPYSAEQLAGKAVCRQALMDELKLEPMPGTPLLGMVTRISSQKGIDLVLEAADALFDLPIQLVVQGLGDPALIGGLDCLEQKHPGRVRTIQRFDAALAQRIYAGCDGFLMPSSFEPCGLGQMIAMRYGTVPIVRSTGGLADTVFEGQNGFTFEKRSAVELIAAVVRAHRAYQSEGAWRAIQGAAMREDHGWKPSAREYVRLYEGGGPGGMRT